MKLGKRWKVGLVAAAVVIAAVGSGAGTLLARGATAAPAVESARVERGDVTARVTASGTVSARRTVLVSSQVSGRLAELKVDFNDTVKRGQLLARIDPRPFAAQVAQSEANAAAARANLAKARTNAAEARRQEERLRPLADRQLASVQEWETARSAAEAAAAEVTAGEASVQQAKAALDQARFNLASTEIRAPIDGIVVSRDVDVGQTVAASLQAPTLFTLAEDLRSMQVQAHVSESDVGRLAEGMTATFTVAAFPRERMTGTVRQVRNAAQTVENVVTYDVVLDVENPNVRLKPGMTANVTFVAAERRGVLRVPNAAFRFDPPEGTAKAPAPAGGERVVYVVDGPALRPVSVRPGLTDGSYTELADGALEPGTLVATRAMGATAATRSTGSARGAGGPPPRMF